VAEDGEAYTKAEFAEYYGGSAEWDRAPRAPPPAATAATAVRGCGGHGGPSHGGLSSLDFVVVSMLQARCLLPRFPLPPPPAT
jgi:hypothetical protein